MPKANSVEWQGATQAIIESTNIKAFYESLGVQFAASKPTTKGWLACHAVDREDRNPSAAVNVGSGPQRGRYRDQGGSGESLSLFDFGAKYGHYTDWMDVRQKLAIAAGIKLPKHNDSLTQLALGKLNLSIIDARSLAKAKQVDPRAIAVAGGVSATWPKFSTQPNPVVAFPCYSHKGLDADPQAWHILGNRGQLITSKAKKGGKDDGRRIASKTKQIGPSGGLFNRHAMIHWSDAKIIWVVEGISDMLAMQSVLANRSDHLVVTAGGCQVQPGKGIPERFGGKDVRVCFDNDKPKADGKQPGQLGAAFWTATLSEFASSVRNVILPIEGTDLREYLSENTYDDLLDMSESIEPVKAKSVADAMVEQLPDDVLANSLMVGEGAEKSIIPVPIKTIFDRMVSQTNDWPKRCESNLFIENKPGDIYPLAKQSELFGFLQEKFPAKIQWQDKGTSFAPATKAEYFSYCQRVCTNYLSIEKQPHFPPIKNFYYSFPKLSQSTGEALNGFLEFFNPATSIDRDLLKAACMTQFWGGPFGTRPVFLFVAKSGRGAGKTATAQAIAELTGGAFSVDKNESVETMKGRLLKPETRSKRVALLDNVKTSRFSWAEFESLITTRYISGHQMYVGESSRPNTLCWMITMNGPNLSTDIAQRVVVVHLDRPKAYGKSWSADVIEFVEQFRWQIVADIQAAFDEHTSEFDDSEASRWAGWDFEVLSRASPEITETLRVLAERRSDVNAEESESRELLEYLREKLSQFGYDTYRDRIHIPTAKMQEWYTDCFGPVGGPRKIAARIRQAHEDGSQPWLMKNPCNAHGRGYLFDPPDAPREPVKYDFDQRGSFRSGGDPW